jgi:hypothetical protein
MAAAKEITKLDGIKGMIKKALASESEKSHDSPKKGSEEVKDIKMQHNSGSGEYPIDESMLIYQKEELKKESLKEDAISDPSASKIDLEPPSPDKVENMPIKEMIKY